MGEDPVGQFAVEADAGDGDLGPVVLCAVDHGVELGAVAGMFGHPGLGPW